MWPVLPLGLKIKIISLKLVKDNKGLKDTVGGGGEGGELPVTTENRYLRILLFLRFSIREPEKLCFHSFQEEFKKEAKDKGLLKFFKYHLKSIFLRAQPQPWLVSSLLTSKNKEKIKKEWLCVRCRFIWGTDHEKGPGAIVVLELDLACDIQMLLPLR